MALATMDGVKARLRVFWVQNLLERISNGSFWCASAMAAAFSGKL